MQTLATAKTESDYIDSLGNMLCRIQVMKMNVNKVSIKKTAQVENSLGCLGYKTAILLLPNSIHEIRNPKYPPINYASNIILDRGKFYMNFL